MGIKTPILFLIVLLMISPSLGEIKTLKLSSNSRPKILLGKFGFTPRGQVSIAVSDVSFNAPDPSLLGFFLFSHEGILRAVNDSDTPNPNPNNTTNCLRSSPYVRQLFTFGDLFINSSYNNSFPVSRPGDYSLFFANCAPESTTTTPVSFAVRVEMFNSLLGDVSRDYLSAGLAPVPTLYSLFVIAYVAFLAAWTFHCLQTWHSTHRIHILMGGLLLAKALNLAFAVQNLNYVRLTGSPLRGSAVLIYILKSSKGILFFTVIALINAGWPFVKPVFQHRKKKVLMLVIPLQLFANLQPSLVFLHDIINIVCGAAVCLSFPTIESLTLREDSKVDGKAASNRAKHVVMEKVRDVLSFYVYFYIFVIPTLKSEHDWWTILAIEEATALAFDVFMLYTLRPKERDMYSVVDDNLHVD